MADRNRGRATDVRRVKKTERMIERERQRERDAESQIRMWKDRYEDRKTGRHGDRETELQGSRDTYRQT